MQKVALRSIKGGLKFNGLGRYWPRGPRVRGKAQGDS